MHPKLWTVSLTSCLFALVVPYAHGQDGLSIGFELVDASGNLDSEALLKQNRERLAKRRKAFASAKTLTQAIEVAKSELKQQGYERIATLMTEDDIVFATKRSLDHQRQLVTKKIKKQRKPGDPLAPYQAMLSEFRDTEAAYAPIIKERKMPPGSFFSYDIGQLEDGQLVWFTLRLSVKPKSETAQHPDLKGWPLLEHQVKIFTLRFGETD